MKASRSSTFCGPLAIAVVAVVALGATASAKPVAKEPKPGTYAGAFYGFESAGEIELELAARGDKRLEARLTDVLVRCEGGSTHGISARMRGDVRRNGRFLLQNRDYYGTGQAYLELRGRITGRRAKGFFYYMSNSYDAQLALDCATFNPKDWKASRR